MQPQAPPPHPPRPQQGQVKLTMAQLTQLTQGQVSNQDLGDGDSYNEQKITVSPPKRGIFIRKCLRQSEPSIQRYSTEFQQHSFRIFRSCKMGFGELLFPCCLEWTTYSEKKVYSSFQVVGFIIKGNYTSACKFYPPSSSLVSILCFFACRMHFFSVFGCLKCTLWDVKEIHIVLSKCLLLVLNFDGLTLRQLVGNFLLLENIFIIDSADCDVHINSCWVAVQNIKQPWLFYWH